MTAATLSPLKRAFLALEEAEAKVRSLETAAREPIAIIGIGCRVPGGVVDGPSFWKLLEEGKDAVGPIPAERWDVDAFFDPDPEAPGKIATRQGGFLTGPVDTFDSAFFGIAPREAQGMDPQQRLLLEVAWEALENAGQAPDKLEKSPTGVFVGVAASDYANSQMKSGDDGLLDAHFTSGIAHSVASGRLSYLLGLQGPSITIDTACSSSLVAVHLACQALRTGDCRMAIAGGVNLILGPELYVALSHSRMLSPDGRCKTFAAKADGFGRGEGCGVVVLKRLSQAEKDGDRVLAVIRGSAVNQDGPSGGLTAPNGPAQEAVIREALTRAGVAPKDVGYVEAHGTGTELGDPLEVQAIGAVFAERDGRPPLVLGSLKTNVGHLEAAAGVAGLIKVVLALRHREIPAHLHYDTPSPHIPWADLPLTVPTKRAAWQPIEGRRLAGISSFGFSGTNAHVVVEEAPPREAAAIDTPKKTEGPFLLTLSARSEATLVELARRYAAALDGRSDADLASFCFTANTGRARLASRATVLAATAVEMRERLALLAEGRAGDATGVRVGHVTRRDPLKVAFLFTGQGAQYAGMAKGLYDAFPAFRTALDRCAELLAPHLSRPLLEVIFPAEGAATPLDETAFTQPALFAVEYALAELWRSFGVTPNAVIGHSVGEYVAACLAGVLSLEDALRLIAKRGALMQSLPPGGAMAAVFGPAAPVVAALEKDGRSARVSIAAINAPNQTVIAGAAADVAAVAEELSAKSIRTKALVVSHAFHSPLVEPILDAFEREVASVTLAAPKLRLVSNLTGALADAAAVTQPKYWRRHVREAVRFGDGIAALAAFKPDVLVELGPQPTLLPFAAAVLGDDGPMRVPSLKKGRPDVAQLLDAVASLYLAGADVDLHSLAPAPVVDVPTYPFERERFWFRAKPKARSGGAGATGKRHPILGAQLRTAGGPTIFEGLVGADDPSWVRHHRVLDRVIMPATGYLEALIAAAERTLGRAASVENVAVSEPMILEDDGARRLFQVVCTPANDGIRAELWSASADDPDGRFTAHASAELRPAGTPKAASPLAEVRGRCSRDVEIAGHYAGFEARGLTFGDRFRPVRALWRGAGLEAVGEIALDDVSAREVSAYRMHPLLLDGCVQVVDAALLGEEGESGERAVYLPIGIGRFTVTGSPGARCFAHVAVSGTGDSRRADVHVYDGTGAIVAELADVQLRRASRDAFARLGDRWLDDALYEVAWRPAPLPPALPEPLALGTSAAAVAGGLRRSAGLDTYDDFQPRLDALCATYVLAAMTNLGWSPAAGEAVEEAPLADRLRIATRHRRLFGRFLAILAEDGWLTRSGRGFVVARALPGATNELAEKERAALEAVAEGGADELLLTARLGVKLAEALRGDVDAMELLFPGGSLDVLERIYRDGPTARYYNGLLAEVLGAIAAARPAGAAPLRILEVGAGTGGTTAHVLPRLAKTAVAYTYTDVGPLFVEKARDRFGAQHPSMRFTTFDLERDPEAQGLEGQSFDIVIGSNCIHATKDLRATLGRIRRVLAPGGLLAMLEVTAPQRWFDLTVGFTEGWWAFTDSDLRQDYATLPRDRWLTLLEATGFDATATLPATAGEGVTRLQSIFLSRAASRPRDWVLFADDAGALVALAARLRTRGDRVLLVRAGTQYAFAEDSATVDPRAEDQVGRLFADLRAADRRIYGVVHGWPGIEGALHVSKATVQASPSPRLWIVTRGATAVPDEAPAWGLAKAVRLEHPEARCVSVDVDAKEPNIDALLAELDLAGNEGEVTLHGGTPRSVARLARAQRAKATPPRGAYRLATSTPGSLEGLGPQPAERRAPGPNQVEVAVEATGLNFKDVLNVLGMYPGDPGPLGGECAGKVTAVGAGVTHVRPGDDVVALGGGSFASHLVARAELVQRRPADMPAEEGASIPIPYLTAAFCLNHLAKMTSSDKVLIHAAAGGVGMAAVRLAQRAGAEIFATAGAPWKKALLRDMGVKHVLDSRSTTFADEIFVATGGRGVDIVLNSLAGDVLDASFRAIAKGGRFVEIGKRGIKEPSWVTGLGRGLEYFIVDWGVDADREPALIGGMLAGLMRDIESGAVRPLPRHVFGLDEAARAFRFMAQARHAGKVVVTHAASGAKPSVRHDGTYLVTGGLSGLGLTVARWLAEQGAGRLVLLGRRGVTAESEPVLAEIRALGATVIGEALDVADEAGLRALLGRVRAEGPPLRGVIHSAGVLDDAALQHQDLTRFAKVAAPKVVGGKLLDELTRCDPLDWFVLFSSVAGVLGSRGQANHSAANAFLDALAHARRERGLPALSIDWGAWTEVGAAAGAAVRDRLAAQGVGALTPAQGIRALEDAMTDARQRPQVVVASIDWKKYLERYGAATPPFFAEVAGRAKVAIATVAGAATVTVDLKKELATAPKGRWRSLVTAFVRARALKTLGLDPDKAVDPKTPLGELGLDSLLAVELRNTLSSALGTSLPASLLFDYPTIEALSEHVLTTVVGAAPEVAPAAPLPPAPPRAAGLVNSIEDLSDDEVERQLAERAKRRT